MLESTEKYVSLSRYDFLVVFIGILIGLSVSKLVSFSGQLIATKRLPRLPLAHGAYLLVAFLFQVHYWWTLWDAKILDKSSFLTFLQLLLLPILMYFATAILCPKLLPDEAGSLEGYFAGRAKVFLLTVFVILLVGGLQGIFLWNQPYQACIVRGVAAVMVLFGIFIPSKRFHSWLAISLLFLFVVYIFGTRRFSHAIVP
jgi:hypothetical protein